MKFSSDRTVLISDTDAAGVVFFGRYPILFHDAYESGLGSLGINLLYRTREDQIHLPVTHLDVQYRRPLVAGDRIRISGESEVVATDTVLIRGSIHRLDEEGNPGKETTRYAVTHTCVSRETMRRSPLPPFWQDVFGA